MNILFYLKITQAISAFATGILLCVICVFGWLLSLEFKQQAAFAKKKLVCVTPDPVLKNPETSIAAIGKDLFRINCATCHNKNMKDNLTGPALGGVTERWSKYPQADLYNFIRNSQGMIQKRHLRAVQVWNENDHIVMISFPNLKDEDIGAILAYIEYIQYDEYRIVD